jgi:hypothetical protein
MSTDDVLLGTTGRSNATSSLLGSKRLGKLHRSLSSNVDQGRGEVRDPPLNEPDEVPAKDDGRLEEAVELSVVLDGGRDDVTEKSSSSSNEGRVME